MALITNYSTLQTEVGNWLERSGTTPVTDNVTTWIQLGEAELNAEMVGLRKTRTKNNSLIGSVSSRNIDISALAFLSPISLVLTTSSRYDPLRRFAVGTHVLSTTNGVPAAWSVEGDNIQLDKPCDQAHTFEFYYHARLNIATDTTNWLLTNFPNVYLYKALKHAAIFFKDAQAAAGYGAVADDIVSKVMAADAKNRTSALVVDAALQRGGSYDINTDAA